MVREGDIVFLQVCVMGITTEEERIVLRVDDDGIWLDNGPGNDPSGPYDTETGEWADNHVIPGASQRISL